MKRQLNHRHTIRRTLAFACIGLGIAGCILPLIPGLPFFVLGGRLLGPRDRTLRLAMLQGRRGVRALRHSRSAHLRRAGTRITPHWRSVARLMLGRA